MANTIRRCTPFEKLPLILAVAWLTCAAAASAQFAAAHACVGGPTRLCLGDRFEVEVTWQDDAGRERAALAMPLGAGGTGAFSFLDAGTIDLLVRVGARAAGRGEVEIETAGLTGAAYEVRVIDRLSGTRSTRSVAADPGDAVRAVTSALARMAALATERMESGTCGDAAHAGCLLGGRFAVRVTFSGPNDRPEPAWTVGGGGQTALFASTENGPPVVALRLIDGRAINGHFWLVSGALSEAEVGIEIFDRTTGNRNRFVKPAGGSASVIELEAQSASAAVVRATLDPTRGVSAVVGPAGGALEAVDAHGTRFRLVVPKDALIAALDVTLTPVATLDGLPWSGGLAGAVYLEPAPLVLSESATLTVTPSPALTRSQELPFSFRGLTGELALAPPRVGGAPLVLPVHRFGGYGIGVGTAADLSAQLARVPTRPESRLLQRLAGILLPLRRSGAPGAVLPATVPQLLQQEYAASIKASVVKMKQGLLDASYPVIRNWQNAVKDTGQSAKLQAQLLEIQAAEITGAVIRYNAAAASASAVEATAAPRVCKSVKAATEMFRAYAQLKARGKAGLVDKKKLDNCLRFQVKFNTLLDWRVPGGSNTHQDVELSILLPFRELGGSFWSVERTKVNEERVTQPECNVFFKLEKIGSPTVSDMMVELLVPAFSRSDDLLSDLGLRLYYEIDPTANQDWRITCTQQIPPAPPIGPITSEFHTSWSGNYTSFHLSEIEEHGFRAKLVKSASPSVYAEKVYNQGSELLYFEEHTLFSVFFKPK